MPFSDEFQLSQLFSARETARLEQGFGVTHRLSLIAAVLLIMAPNCVGAQQEIPGLGGVRLTTTLPPRTSATSEPVFKVTGDMSGFALAFTHGGGLPEALIIGDRDSLFYPSVTVPLMTDKTNDIR